MDKPEANNDEPQPVEMTACKACGSFDFKCRSNAIIDEEGYLDQGGNFVAISTETDERNAVFDLVCMDCGANPDNVGDDEASSKEDP